MLRGRPSLSLWLHLLKSSVFAVLVSVDHKTSARLYLPYPKVMELSTSDTQPAYYILNFNIFSHYVPLSC